MLNAAVRKLGLVLLYAVFAAIALGANPFRNETVGPFDLLASYPGWNEDEKAVEVRHRERSDILDSFLPMWINAREQIRDGNIPLWNPLRAGGSPALLDPTRALLTPAFVVFTLVPDQPQGFYFATLLNLVIAGIGMHLLVRRYFRLPAALFSGSTYMLCGFITGWLYWPHTGTAIWIPWLLLCVDSYVSRGKFKNLIPIAIATAFLFLGGFPLVVAMGLGAALVWALVKSLCEDLANTVPNLIGTCLGIFLGLGLVALPLLNLAEMINHVDISYRGFGTSFSVSSHLKLLSWPWAQQEPRVESSMYVGMIALVAALVGMGSFFSSTMKSKTILCAGLALATFGVVLTFGLLPREIGGRIPVLSSNIWSRFILLLDIGLILLASAGIDWLQSGIRSHRFAVAVVGTLAVVQASDLIHQFRMFNGPVSAKFYFPVSPELAELRKRTKPFQYVGQDSSVYLMSGTLGAVGLGEWHGHSLRSPPLRTFLKAIAPDSMTTPTATHIRLDKYRWSYTLMDAAGICYAAAPPNEMQWPKLYALTGATRTALAPINGQVVRQPIRLDGVVDVPAVAIRMATYNKRELDGRIGIGLAVVGSAEVEGGWTYFPASAVRDNEFMVFEFDKPVHLSKGDYEILMRYEPGDKKMNLTAWVVPHMGGTLSAGSSKVQGALEHTVFKLGQNELKVLKRGKKGMAAENPGCALGAYFASGLGIAPPNRNSSFVQLSTYRPDRFAFKVEAPMPGYVIVPMQYRSGWSAAVNDVPAKLDTVAGVMPAVPVPAGRSAVRFSYSPPRLFLGAAIMTLTALLLLAAGLWSRREGKA